MKIKIISLMIAASLSAMESNESRSSQIILGNWKNQTPYIISFGQKFGNWPPFESSKEFVQLLPARNDKNRQKFLNINLGPIPFDRANHYYIAPQGKGNEALLLRITKLIKNGSAVNVIHLMRQFEDNSFSFTDFNTEFSENLRIFIHGRLRDKDVKITFTHGSLNVPYKLDESIKFSIED